jgi:hypothetical protein
MTEKGKQIEEYFRGEVHRLYTMIQANLDILNFEKFYMTRGYLNAISLALGRSEETIRRPKLRLMKGGMYLPKK